MMTLWTFLLKLFPQKKKRKRNRMPKDAPLPEDENMDREFWRHPNVSYATSRWQSYTNFGAVDEIKSVLSVTQLEMFRDTCFGHFLDMPKANDQLQIIHCLMNKELNHTPDDVFAVELSGSRLFFGLREFAIVTGLNCVSTGISKSLSEPSCLLMNSYFSGQKTVHKKELRASFLSKTFKSDFDAVCLAVLFFIHEFLFSYEHHEQQVSPKDFFLVESGLFNSYHWGLDVFLRLLSSVRHTLRSSNQYYRIGGFPFALQVWIYECCSIVSEDIAIRCSESIPRIVRWRTIAECPWRKHIENGLLNPSKNKICRAEAAYLEQKRALDEKEKEVIVEKKKERQRIPGKLVKSPYVQEFDSGGTLCLTRQIFGIKHPFNGLGIDPDLINSFTSWLDLGLNKRRKKNPYSVADNKIEPAYELGVLEVDCKDWFYRMAQSGQQWCDEHIDVILYYLQKKGKYDPVDSFTFTTTDCCFKTKVASTFFEMCDAQRKNKEIKVSLSDTIAEYMSGRRLLANTPWNKVNFVLIPVNIEKNQHWILVVFDIINRTLLVYDSLPSRGNNYRIKNAVDILSSVLPHYLSLTICGKRSDLCPAEYDGKTPLDRLKVKHITKGVPTQKDDSLDCGVFVAAFAELISNGQKIANQKLKAENLRKRFGALLWNYATMKQDMGLQSEDERPKRLK